MVTGSRAFGMNSFVGGGFAPTGSPAGTPGIYGITYPDTPTYFHNDFANPAGAAGRTLGWVNLGAKLTRFKNTSEKILVVEKIRPNSGAAVSGSNPITRGGGIYGANSETNGQYSFRHNKKTRMNTLMLDGHVESFHYQDTTFNVARRYNFVN